MTLLFKREKKGPNITFTVTLICIMTMMNIPSEAIWGEKSLRSPLHALVDCVCSRQLGWWGSNMEEAGWTLVARYGRDGWRLSAMNKQRRLEEIKASAGALRNANSKSTSLLPFFPAILCLRVWTKWLIKPKMKKTYYVWGAGEETPLIISWKWKNTQERVFWLIDFTVKRI